MSKIVDVKIRIPSWDLTVLSWKIEGDDPYGAHRVEIFKAQGEGLGEKIADLPGTSTRFLDQKQLSQRFLRRIKYTLRSRVIATDEIVDTIARPEQAEDVTAMALALELKKLLKAQLGNPFWVYQRKSYGDRCPDCFDTIRQRTGKSNCTTCYGTTFVGGFEEPVFTYISDRTPADIIEQAGFMEMGVVRETFWMANYPDINPGDVLLAEQNQRWLVERIHQFSKRESVFRQVMVVNGLEPSRVEAQLKHPGFS